MTRPAWLRIIVVDMEQQLFVSKYSLMSRPRKISCEQIIETARKLFLQQGIGVSTAAIAKEMGVSEGLIFKRFPTKDELFLAAMCPPETTLDQFIAARVGHGDVRQNIRELCNQVIGHLREVLPRMMLMFAHHCSPPLEWMKNHPSPPPLRLLRQICRYLEEETNLGRIASNHTQILARILLGSLHNYVFLEIIGADRQVPLPQHIFVHELVELVWKGISDARTPQ